MSVLVDTQSGGVNSRWRILLVTHGYPPNQRNGAELHAHRKARWFHNQGHTVHVLTADPHVSSPEPFRALDEYSDTVDGVDVRRARFAVPDATSSVRDTFKNPRLVNVLEGMIDEFHPDFVYLVSGYLWGVLPLQIAESRGIPTVLFATDYWHVCQRTNLLRPDGTTCSGPRSPADCAACRIADRAFTHRLGPSVNRLWWHAAATLGRAVGRTEFFSDLCVEEYAERETEIREAVGSASLVVASSQFVSNWMRRLGVSPDRLLTIRQGIDESEYSAVPVYRTSETGVLSILYLGQLAHHKGTDLLVKSVAGLRDQGHQVRLDLHGSPSEDVRYMDRLQRYIDGHHIRLGSPLTRHEVIGALHQADVLVVPSRCYDNSPNVVLEAFACGLPVVVPRHGGIAEMVDDGANGLHFAPGSVASLTSVVHRLISEPELLPILRTGIRRPQGVSYEMSQEEVAIDRVLGPVATREDQPLPILRDA